MAIIPSQIDNDRKDFFKNCEYVIKVPASLFLEGNRHSQKAKILPIPLYAYVGIENGYSEFSYEEFNCDLEASMAKVKEVADILGLPRDKSIIEKEKDLTAAFLLSKVPEEEIKWMTTTPHSSFINYRRTYYPDFLNRHYKENLRYAMVTPKVIREANIKKRSVTMDARIKILQLRDKYLAKNSNELFKLKVWSEIPFTGGLNEGAAIATATALALQLRLSPEEIQERMAELDNLRENLWEEVAIDGWFMTVFTRALALDFFANGAAVFASLFGCNREQEVINYECLVFDEIKDYFNPYPQFEKKEERKEFDKNKGIIPYFDKCIKLKYNCMKAEPLYTWNFEKLTFKDKLAMAIISEPNVVHQRENFEIPQDLNIKCWRVSPYFHALIDDPSTVALCVANPERHIFRFERKSLSPRGDMGHSMFDIIYNSRRQGWGAHGVEMKELVPMGPEEVKMEQMTGRPKEIEVNFSKDENYIKFDGKETGITGDRIFSLLEELINRKVLHWSWGLVVFDGWENKVPDDPAGQFRVEKDRFNSKFGFDLIECVPQEKKKKKKRRWTLIKGVIIKSSIEESDSLCKEAVKEEDHQKKLELLDRALLYQHSLRAIRLLLNLLQENPPLINKKNDSTEKLLPSVYEVLVKRRNKLKGATERIEEKGRNKGWPGDWGEVIPYFHIMHRELSEVEAYLKIAEKFLEKKEVVPREDELNIICEEWKILERLAKSEQSKEESKHYKEQLYNQHLKRPLIKEILNKISSKINFKIREELRLRKFEPEDIAQEVQIFYSGLIRKGYLSKMNFKNIEELKGNLIKGLSLKIRDEIIKGKNKDIFTDSNLKRIREVWKIKKELRQKWEREPRDEDVLKKLGPQWDSEKLKEVKEMIKELYKGEEDIDMEKYLKFFEEAKAYEKNREGIELFFES